MGRSIHPKTGSIINRRPNGDATRDGIIDNEVGKPQAAGMAGHNDLERLRSELADAAMCLVTVLYMPASPAVRAQLQSCCERMNP